MFYRILTGKNELSEDGDTLWLCDECVSEYLDQNKDAQVIDRARYWSDEAIGVSCDHCNYGGIKEGICQD